MAWRLLDFQKNNIFENMAIDEAVFIETVRGEKEPTIRFYASAPPAVTLGYFQEAEKEINIGKCRDEGIDIARRITGGRAVYHFQEITYSLAAGGREKIFPADISGTYELISRCMSRGLSRLGIASSLEKEGRERIQKDMSACCFSSPSKNELLVNGRKICGSAQVRRRGGFLQHGLMLMDFDPGQIADLLAPGCPAGHLEKLKTSVTSLRAEGVRSVDRTEIIAGLIDGFVGELGIELQPGRLTAGEESLKNELMKKYTNSDWNIRRAKYF